MQANQEVRRDFLLPVTSVGQLFKGFGKELDRVIIVDPKVEGRLVYIHLKNKSYGELYGFLRDAVGIGVIDKNGALTVTDVGSPIAEPMISPEFVHGQIETAMSSPMDRAGIKQYLLDSVSSQGKLVGSKSGENIQPILDQQREIQLSDPTAQLGLRLLKEIGVQQLMALPEFERVVFSTSPTSMQRAWVGNASGLMRETTEAVRILGELRVELNIPDKTQRVIVFDDRAAPPVPKSIAHMRAVVKRTNTGFTVNVHTFSSEGERLSSATFTLQGSDRNSTRYANDAQIIDPLIKDLPVVTSLAESDLLELERLRKLSIFDAKRPVLREDLEWMANVDEKEPFSGIVSRLFDQVMDGLGREAVLHIAGDTNYLQNRQSPDLAKVARVLLSTVPRDRLWDKEAVLVCSSIGGMDRLWVPRKAKAELARRLLAKGSLTLWDLSDLSLRLTDRMQLASFVNYALNVAGQSAAESFIEPGGLTEMLLFSYSRLPESSQRAMATEAGIQMHSREMPGGLSNLFNQSVRSTEMSGAVVRTFSFDNGGNMVPVAPKGWPSGLPLNALMEEQTNFLPLADFSPLSLRMSLNEASGVLVEETFGGQFTRRTTMGLPELANQIAKREIAESQGITQGSQLNGFAGARMVRVSISILGGDFAAASRDFTFLARPAGELGTRENLPEGTRLELDRLVIAARENFSNVKFVQPPGKGVRPPPPNL